MKIVVVGGAGFIGSHIVEHFHRQAEVIVLDNLRTGFKKNLDGLDCKLVEASVLNREAVFDCCNGADYVYNLAALVSVPESMEKPFECNDINLNGLINVLDAAKKFQVKKVVLSSSAAVYGPSSVMPKVETMLPEPVSPYAITKLAGEYYLDMYYYQYGVPTVSLRYFNVFGPRQSPLGAYAAVVPIFIEKALNGQPLTIYGDGQQIRDFIYVKDVVRANEMALDPAFAHGVYNVASGQTITISELAGRIVKLAGSQSVINYAPVRAGDLPFSSADISKIKGLGFLPSYSFDDGLACTISAMRTCLNG